MNLHTGQTQVKLLHLVDEDINVNMNLKTHAHIQIDLYYKNACHCILCQGNGNKIIVSISYNLISIC